MDEVFQQLEARIRTLIKRCEQLEHVNQNLMHNKTQLMQEKEIILKKNKIAIAQIESMISRLRACLDITSTKSI
ncbi:MAG: hypothetical protein ACD_60C00072G0011 [uncultured bacterium]|nr:MAG: hypothetical protein ACD_60C00072G0011 [uncultured bacterium]